MSDLIPIGQFAALTSLSPKALRIYQEQGLLTPAAVDAKSGYRYYSADQLPEGSRIALLRQAGIPLAEIAAYLADPSIERVSRWQVALEEEHARRRRLLAQIIFQPQERKASNVTSPSEPPACTCRSDSRFTGSRVDPALLLRTSRVRCSIEVSRLRDRGTRRCRDPLLAHG